MLIQQEIENILKNLKPILSDKYFIERIGYFGCYYRNEQVEKSDIDILVDFQRPIGWSSFDVRIYKKKI
jgi:uncharacterized protein